MDLNPAVKALQQVGSGLQAAGQAAGQAVGLTPAKLQAAGAQLQVGTQAALIDAAKHVVRTIGVDSNLPNTATPGSEYGEISLPRPHCCCTHTVMALHTCLHPQTTFALHYPGFPKDAQMRLLVVSEC